MWGLKPYREPTNGDKAENKFSPLYPHSLLTVGCFAPHSHPSPPEKKVASRKKSRLRRKKTAATEFRVGTEKVLQFGYKSYCHSRCLVGFLVRNYIAAIGRGSRQSIFQNRWSGYLLYCKLLLYLQCGLATFVYNPTTRIAWRINFDCLWQKRLQQQVFCNR